MRSEELFRLVSDFNKISGMEIAVIDEKYHSVCARRSSYANFCSRMHASGALNLCKESDIEHLMAAREGGAPILYTCPFGIRELIIPINKNDSVIGYIFCSLGIDTDNACCDLEVCARAAEHIDTSCIQDLEESIRKMPHYSSDMMTAYYGMLILLKSHIEGNGLLSDDNESIGQLIKNYVKGNLSRKITLADISWNLHCSTVTLTEHFKREFGISIMDYVSKKRMSLAKHLLCESSMTISEIARECGYADVEYFSRSFKRAFGKSPSIWRKESLNG